LRRRLFDLHNLLRGILCCHDCLRWMKEPREACQGWMRVANRVYTRRVNVPEMDLDRNLTQLHRQMDVCYEPGLSLAADPDRRQRYGLVKMRAEEGRGKLWELTRPRK